MFVERLLFIHFVFVVNSVFGNGLQSLYTIDQDAASIALNVVHGLEAPSALTCAMFCLSSTSCKSFSFDTHNVKCTGYSLASTDTEAVIPENTYFYYSNDIDICSVSRYMYRPTHNYCYKFMNSLQSWSSATSSCQSNQGNLLILDTVMKKNYFIEAATNYYGAGQIWIGGYENNGSWVWWNGTPMSLSRTFWYRKEPNEFYPNEDCAAIWIGMNGFLDNICSGRKYYICERF